MNETLIYDLETATQGSRIDPTKDKLRVFGCYSYLTNKYYCLTKESDIRAVIKKHKYFVGFKNMQYDNCVLFNNGYYDLINKNNYGDYRLKGKVNIDLMQIFKSRCGAMKIKEGMLGDLLMSFSLDYITKTLGLVDDGDGKIKGFDYDILKKPSWTKEEVKLIKDYTERDLEITKKLYEWCEEYFSGFKAFLTPKDVEDKCYLTSAVSVFTYKAICKELDLKEEYDDAEGEKYGGGYVAYPAGESFEGIIIALDYNSLYPHIFSQCNLYSHNRFGKGWNGNKKFKVKGWYNDEEMGAIEKLLMKFYSLRKEYKKVNDPREYAIKIIINTAYGLSGNPSFKHLYNQTTASDCTSLARQWVMLARTRLAEAGLEVIYTDTDSIYFRVNNGENYMNVKDNIVKEIKDNVPFPQDTFDLGIDYEISNMWFFKGKVVKDDDKYMDEMDIVNRPKGFMKKNYIFLTNSGEVVVKNLGVRKKSTSALSRHIFWEILVPRIKAERKVKWSKTFFKNLINELLAKDLELATVRFNVKGVSAYKNASQIQCQIAERYGAGIHFLVPNKHFGIGKGTKKYCLVNEFKDKNMTIDDLDLTGVWSELGYFILADKVMDLGGFFDVV